MADLTKLTEAELLDCMATQTDSYTSSIRAGTINSMEHEECKRQLKAIHDEIERRHSRWWQEKTGK